MKKKKCAITGFTSSRPIPTRSYLQHCGKNDPKAIFHRPKRIAEPLNVSSFLEISDICMFQPLRLFPRQEKYDECHQILKFIGQR